MERTRIESPATQPTACSTLKIRTGGATHSTTDFPLAVPFQDLSGDKLIASAARVRFGDIELPSLGGIALIARIGHGGMGSVYYGVNPRLLKEVAIKVLPYHLAEKNPQVIARFYREAQLAAQIFSPHLVGVMDVNDENGLYFLVMEYIHGVSCEGYLRKARIAPGKGLQESEALDICIGATEGLAAAHCAGIIHRDVKPGNIMIPVTRDPGAPRYELEKAKLADLGLARGDAAAGMTGSGAAMGTPGFMPPEQAQDARSCGKAADVFAMGATLYNLLSGNAPFAGATLMKVLQATVEEPHVPISTLRPDISAPTVALFERCLAKDPSKRYVDASALLEALRVCREALELPQKSFKAVMQISALVDAEEVGKSYDNTVAEAEDASLEKSAAAPAPGASERTLLGAASEPKPPTRGPATKRPPSRPETKPRSRIDKRIWFWAGGLLAGAAMIALVLLAIRARQNEQREIAVKEEAARKDTERLIQEQQDKAKKDVEITLKKKVNELENAAQEKEVAVKADIELQRQDAEKKAREEGERIRKDQEAKAKKEIEEKLTAEKARIEELAKKELEAKKNELQAAADKALNAGLKTRDDGIAKMKADYLQMTQEAAKLAADKDELEKQSAYAVSRLRSATETKLRAEFAYRKMYKLKDKQSVNNLFNWRGKPKTIQNGTSKTVNDTTISMPEVVLDFGDETKKYDDALQNIEKFTPEVDAVKRRAEELKTAAAELQQRKDAMTRKLTELNLSEADKAAILNSAAAAPPGAKTGGRPIKTTDGRTYSARSIIKSGHEINFVDENGKKQTVYDWELKE